MSRSVTKGPFVAYHLIKKINSLNKNKTREVIKTWSRSSTILPSMLGHTISVYNGKKHIPVDISEALIGHKLGEFSFTKTFKTHKKADRKIKKK